MILKSGHYIYKWILITGSLKPSLQPKIRSLIEGICLHCAVATVLRMHYCAIYKQTNMADTSSQKTKENRLIALASGRSVIWTLTNAKEKGKYHSHKQLSNCKTHNLIRHMCKRVQFPGASFIRTRQRQGHISSSALQFYINIWPPRMWQVWTPGAWLAGFK